MVELRRAQVQGQRIAWDSITVNPAHIVTVEVHHDRNLEKYGPICAIYMVDGRQLLVAGDLPAISSQLVTPGAPPKEQGISPKGKKG